MEDYADLVQELENNRSHTPVAAKEVAKPEVTKDVEVDVNHEEHETPETEIDNEDDLDYLNKDKSKKEDLDNDDDDVEDEEEELEESSDKKNFSKGAEKKINKQRKIITEQDNKLSALQRELQEIKLIMAGSEAHKETKESITNDGPKYEDYDTMEAFMKDTFEYHRNKENSIKAEVEAKKSHEERYKKIIEKYSDYEDKMANLNKVQPPSQAAVNYINDNAMGDDILYYLANNLKVAEELSSLKAYEQVEKLVQIKNKLSSRFNKTAKDIPEPITPQKKNATKFDASTYDGDDLVAKYIKSREKK